MEPLDGNAIAGPLRQYFGVEMTTAEGACSRCGTVAQVAELRVYSRAPGTVVRCAHCGSVVMVLTEVRDSLQIDTAGFRLARQPDR